MSPRSASAWECGACSSSWACARSTSATRRSWRPRASHSKGGRSARSLSFMRRERDTPNGLMEFLVVQSVLLLRERGIREVSLNFAAFAQLIHRPRGHAQRVLGRLLSLGDAFFQIESLYRFNA